MTPNASDRLSRRVSTGASDTGRRTGRTDVVRAGIIVLSTKVLFAPWAQAWEAQTPFDPARGAYEKPALLVPDVANPVNLLSPAASGTSLTRTRDQFEANQSLAGENLVKSSREKEELKQFARYNERLSNERLHNEKLPTERLHAEGEAKVGRKDSSRWSDSRQEAMVYGSMGVKNLEKTQEKPRAMKR
ncbi:MAG: hypothetical protein C5B49_13365 [Bdellovibrio sp.]|nr:MAG: hypothetical protein C5B49_13365 [Bdellovibrio sp.]